MVAGLRAGKIPRTDEEVMACKEVNCCEQGAQTVIWRDNFSESEESGFAVPLHTGGDVYYERITFCPWCGRPVPDTPKNCRTSDEDREVEVHIEFDLTKLDKAQQKLLTEITCAFGKLGVGFDTGHGSGCYDWEWDWSLSGPVKVLFRTFVVNNPKNRHTRKSIVDADARTHAVKLCEKLAEEIKDDESN